MISGDSLFYYPSARGYGAPEEYGLDYESVYFSSRDEIRLHGWFFRARAPARGTVLHFHGNAGNITGHFHHVAWLPAAGWSVFVFDYRGYGQSEGEVTRAGTIADGHAALDYLLSRSDVAKDQIVGFGQSLGGAVGAVVAAERPEIRGLVIDGGFDSYQGIAHWHVRQNPLLFCVGWWVPPLMISKGYDPIDYIGRIAPRPVLIMHGTRDAIVDPAMAHRLYEAAGEPKKLWLIEGADHYGAFQDRLDESAPLLLNFLQTAIGPGE